ncbi:Sushi, von Willebrand factor type A, EGF and pentraxin domain-containing protein 1 [Liparis tanakae]|uniref:Sushi, von Willebrand factor type A, EGF and pentraxin domain-containing protein 1 n=1 Tax=Liparis tanakae TaxID=230148 RepID=A0A4Z2I412_9TELE|nr:Sushi, von Willebrand factor type A, EGF and pentraxin domain-containing protein 1 [Liparis tanakae]
MACRLQRRRHSEEIKIWRVIVELKEGAPGFSRLSLRGGDTRNAEPPGIQCPGNIVAGTDERRNTANVSWNVPTATDNSKEEVAVQVKPVYTPPQLFPIGKETITYIGTDRSGNQANCSFTVTVIDTEPPVIDRCRSPPTIRATGSETAAVWEVPQFSDNSGMSGLRSQTAAPEMVCNDSHESAPSPKTPLDHGAMAVMKRVDAAPPNRLNNAERADSLLALAEPKQLR